MAIWAQVDTTINFQKSLTESKKCVYCRTQMADITPRPSGLEWQIVQVCPLCGWWIFFNVKHTFRRDPFAGQESSCSVNGNYSVLRNMDLADLSLPVDEIRRFLIARYEIRFKVHPRRFEDTVADVFKDAGYRPRVTGYRADGGIDIILDGNSDRPVGVEVKRWHGKIKVSQIRDFCGALFLKGITKGIFVTTSDFTLGSKRSSDEAKAQGVPIILINADKFYDALKLYQRPIYSTLNEWRTEVGDIQLHSIERTPFGYEP